jgi:response regulator RpfG family c-di-GMP phosphodiesterase
VDNGFTILVLDDEENILKSVKRLFHSSSDIECLTSTDPYEAQDLLKNRRIDLVISDERMPKIKGHLFLAFVKEHYPFTVRIILTGYAEPEVLSAAINRGEVYRFIQKPWDDKELVLTVKRALEHGKLIREHHELEEELKRKNRELEQLNSRLEVLVQRRTAELQRTLQMLKASRDKAVGGFMGTTNILSSMIHLFQRDIGSHARRVADLCERITPLMKLNKEQQGNLIMAAYFHEIGRVGGKEDSSDSEAKEKYAEIGENIISQGMGMKEIGTIIRHHREHFDGTGRPDALAGQSIPLESRILKVIAEYEWMIHRDKKSVGDAIAFLLQHCDSLYDPEVVLLFHQLLKDQGETESYGIKLSELKPGMELLSDIFLEDGVLFLPGKTLITSEVLDRISRFENLFDDKKVYYVRTRKKGEGINSGKQ